MKHTEKRSCLTCCMQLQCVWLGKVHKGSPKHAVVLSHVPPFIAEPTETCHHSEQTRLIRLTRLKQHEKGSKHSKRSSFVQLTWLLSCVIASNSHGSEVRSNTRLDWVRHAGHILAHLGVCASWGKAGPIGKSNLESGLSSWPRMLE